MRVIVNETQYNKILLEERILQRSVKKWASYLADIMTPQIVKLNKKFKEDAFVENNLVNKLREQDFLDKLPIESIIVNVHQKKGDKLKIETFYNPYWTSITEDKSGKKYIVDAEFDMEVSLPENIDEYVYGDIHKNMVTNLTEQFTQTHTWFNRILNEQKLEVATGVDLDEKEEAHLKLLNFDFYRAIQKLITIEKFEDDGTVTIKDEFTTDEIKRLKDYSKSHHSKFSDIKNSGDGKLVVSLVDHITFGDESLFKTDNLQAYKSKTSQGSSQGSSQGVKKKQQTIQKQSTPTGGWVDTSKGRVSKDIAAGTVNDELLKDIATAAERAGIKVYVSSLRTNHTIGVSPNFKKISRHCFGDGADIAAFDTGNGWINTDASTLNDMPDDFKQAGDRLVATLESMGYESRKGNKRYVWKCGGAACGGNHYNHIHLGNVSNDSRSKKIKEWCKKMIKNGHGNTRISPSNDFDTFDPSSKVKYDDLSLSEKKTFTGVATGSNKDGNYEANYKDGKKDGLYKMWHKNGQLRRKFNYKDGKWDGLQQSWDENGQQQYEGKWKNGKLSSQKCWDSQGNEKGC